MKEELKCSIDNDKCHGRVYGVKKFGNVFCGYHRNHLTRYGRIKEKTILNPNEIIIECDYAVMVLRDINCKEVGRTRFDKCDIEKVICHKWCLSGGYTITCDKTRKKNIRLHTILLGKKDGKFVDHKNRDRLDNRRSNLRFVSRTTNNRNLSISKRNTSGVVGVSYYEKEKRYIVQIGINSTTKYLGRYKTFEEAVRVRKQAELKYYGEILKR